MSDENKNFKPTAEYTARIQLIHLYIENCRANAVRKCPRYFQVKNLIPVFKKNVKSDLMVHFCNNLYTPLYVFLGDMTFWFEQMGQDKPKEFFERLPVHWKSGLQRKMEEFLLDEIFEVNDLSNHRYKATVNRAIGHFNGLRNQKFDLNLSLVSLGLGLLFFKKHGFSLSSVTKSWAKAWANEEASESFFLGKGAGNVYYSLFPTEPQFWHLALAAIGVLSGYALLVYLFNSTLFILQIHFDLYDRRIKALIEHVEAELYKDLKEKDVSHSDSQKLAA